MSGRDQTSWAGAIWRFLTWRGRINRAQFGLGYLGVCFGGALLGFVNLGIHIALGVSLDEFFSRPILSLPHLLPGVIVIFSLLAMRAHDLGWPAAIGVGAYLVPFVPGVIVFDRVMGLSNGAITRACAEIGLSFDIAQKTLALCIVAYWLIVLLLLALPGRPEINRYGAPPKALIAA